MKGTCRAALQEPLILFTGAPTVEPERSVQAGDGGVYTQAPVDGCEESSDSVPLKAYRQAAPFDSVIVPT